MIILSQDKQAIINLENIQVIKIKSLLEDNNAMFKIFAETDGSIYLLGKYGTEERAKEILAEIISFWDGGAMTECHGFICYKMP